MTDRGDDSAAGDPPADASTDGSPPGADEAGAGDSPASGATAGSDADEPSSDGTHFETAKTGLARGEAVYERYLGDWNRLAVALAAIVVVGLVLRLVLLGARVAHYDEGRVAYWSLHHARTDSFVYRFIIHGPFVQHVQRWLFPLVGANDFTMRLPVALVGAGLPGSVWLFRKHLRDTEAIGTALLLALNPLLLYYSRFMRSDILLATFMFVALGMLVRFYDTRRVRYLYGVGLFVALGFSSKENAIVYLLTWGGATALLIDHALFRPRSHESGLTVLVTKTRATADWGRRAILRTAGYYLAHLVGAVFLTGFVVLFMYAPRGDVTALVPTAVPGTATAVGFWQGITSPSQWGRLLDVTLNGFAVEQTARTYPQTFDGIIGGLEYWFGAGAHGSDGDVVAVYLDNLWQFVDVLVTVALPFMALAVLGTLLERYGRPVSRNLVMFSAYTGFVSLLGYPLGTDIFGAWVMVHVLVPLSIPAGVMLAKVYRWSTDAFADEDALSVAISALILLLVVGQMLFVGVGSVYTNSASGDNVMVQYAQPSNDLRDPLADLDRIAATHDGSPDLVVYGTELTDDTTPTLDTQPHCVKWYNPMLPLPWYLYSDDVTVECERGAANLTERIETNPPPVVLVADRELDVPTDVLEASYVRKTGDLRRGDRGRVFWVHESWLSDGDRVGDQSA